MGIYQGALEHIKEREKDLLRRMKVSFLKIIKEKNKCLGINVLGSKMLINGINQC